MRSELGINPKDMVPCVELGVCVCPESCIHYNQRLEDNYCLLQTDAQTKDCKLWQVSAIHDLV